MKLTHVAPQPLHSDSVIDRGIAHQKVALAFVASCIESGSIPPITGSHTQLETKKAPETGMWSREMFALQLLFGDKSMMAAVRALVFATNGAPIGFIPEEYPTPPIAFEVCAERLSPEGQSALREMVLRRLCSTAVPEDRWTPDRLALFAHLKCPSESI